MIFLKLSQIKDVERFYDMNYKKYIFDTTQKDTFLRDKKTEKVLIVIDHPRASAKRDILFSLVS